MNSYNNLAPIALFAYQREDHLKQCLDSLIANPLAIKSDLFIFSDAAANIQAQAGVSDVRKLINSDFLKDKFHSITIIEREQNFGLANSIIDGVTKLNDQYGKVIVLEDDLVLSPYFLEFMNQGLDIYANNNQVASICGYTYPVKNKIHNNFFLKGTDCWGWATWQRAWQLFEPDGNKLLKLLKSRKLIKQFDWHGLVGNSAMLKNQIIGKNNSWAIRWHASIFLQNMYSLVPQSSLVINIGNDLSGEHCIASDNYTTKLTQSKINIKNITNIYEDPVILSNLNQFFASIRPGFLARLKQKLCSLKI